MLRLYTFYTPSHEILYNDYLLPSASRLGFSVIPCIHTEQLCNSAEFSNEGWRLTQLKKVENYIKNFEENRNEIIVGSDADVQILKPCANELISFLGKNDISFQENLNEKICSGFFIAKCNDNVIDFFERVRKSLSEELNNSSVGGGEQYEIWKLLESGNHQAKVGKLPKNEVWNPRLKYETLDELIIPKNIMIHHANWTHGLESKIKQLEHIKTKFNEM